MNKLDLKGSSNEVNNNFNQQYANLTDNNLLLKKRKKEELFGRLQNKIGKSKEDIRNLIEML